MLVLKHSRRAYKLISVLCKSKLLLNLQIRRLARIWRSKNSSNVLLLITGTSCPLSVEKLRLSMVKWMMSMTPQVSNTSFLRRWHWATKIQMQSKSIKIINRIKLLAHRCWNRCQSSPLRRKSWIPINLWIKKTQIAQVIRLLHGLNSPCHQLPTLGRSC